MSALQLEASRLPKPAGFVPSYGTAGFRAEASLLTSTVFRCGVLMAARALQTGQATGIVITASHNPVEDNGVKLVDPSGEMLAQEWEVHANRLVQADSVAQLCSDMQSLLSEEKIHSGAPVGHAEVLLAHDTRPSAEVLTQAAAAGVRALGVPARLLGAMHTPHLHWQVQQLNRVAQNGGEQPSIPDYFSMMASSFETVLCGTQPLPAELHIDCANGVGAQVLQEFFGDYAASAQLAGYRATRLHNVGEGQLNHLCGADYVQKERVLPPGFAALPPEARCASIDGDADRLVYFIPCGGGSNGLQVLDGDRIAVLAAVLLNSLLPGLPPSITAQQPVKVGIVQTAYANGGSTRYMRQRLGLEVALTPTGVKHLHHEAKRFDIGIYFEANGHGTVLFQPALLHRLQQLVDEEAAGEAHTASSAACLFALASLMNQAVGDAVSGILLVEAALRHKRWSLHDWAALYADLPSRQLKVKVADRSVITTADAETRAVTPAGLQACIDAAVSSVPSGRAFVRPSGTEDVVRVYAEAETQGAADALACTIAGHVHDLASGVGARPA